jgi:hypothetical protein
MWWMLSAVGVVVLLLAVGVPTVASLAQAIPGPEQTQLREAITADVEYRNGRMVGTPPASSFRQPAFPTRVTAAEKARLEHAPIAGSTPDTFVDFRTSIDVTSSTRKGDDVVVDFTETTTMPRPAPLPAYGYATSQVATLVKSHGAWLVDDIVFARGSGEDGADCPPGRWAGDC